MTTLHIAFFKENQGYIGTLKKSILHVKNSLNFRRYVTHFSYMSRILIPTTGVETHGNKLTNHVTVIRNASCIGIFLNDYSYGPLRIVKEMSHIRNKLTSHFVKLIIE